ncbi:MAG: DEAD/DEAH box helicase [Actinobacteria bacterium]|nr:DEAD/DEAH box helicase [Actinomycetota bacterium]
MKLYLDKNEIILDFPFDPTQVAEIKTIPGAKWDKLGRVWRLPITSIDEGRQFALRHKFDVAIDAMRFTVPRMNGSVSPSSSRRVYLKDGMIVMRFPYERVIIKAVKQIPAVSWNSKAYAWTAPLSSVSSVMSWAKSFDVSVDAEISQMASTVESEMSALIEASRSTDAEISISGLSGQLLPYQRAGVSYASNARRAFIADEMGLGKTIQALATLEYVHDSYPAVVVCPPSLVLNWANEYTKWLPHRRVATVTNRKVFPDSGSYDVVVVGYSNISTWEKQLLNHRSYVFDESHYAKTPTAQRTKAAVKIARSAPKEGLILCLTGTPVTNRPNEYASQLDILGRLKDFGGLWGFYRRYCAAYQDSFGQWNISGHSHLDELNDRLRGTCYIRRTKEQVLSELPPVIHSKLVVEGSAQAMKEYDKAEKDIILYIAERARALAIEQGKPQYGAAVAAMIRAEANEHLVRLSVLRRLAAKAKMEIVNEWIDERVNAGRKVVVAAHHRDIVDEIARRHGNLRIQGGMSVDDVEVNKHKFQTLPVGEAPVIVLSIQAAKTGHTLTASEECLFVELPWTPADVDQTYSRLHRIGQKGSVTATYLVAKGTIDEDIYNLIESKRSVVGAAVDGGVFTDDDGAVQLILNLLSKVEK